MALTELLRSENGDVIGMRRTCTFDDARVYARTLPQELQRKIGASDDPGIRQLYGPKWEAA